MASAALGAVRCGDGGARGRPVAAAVCARIVVPPTAMLRKLGTALGVGDDAGDAPAGARSQTLVNDA